MTWQTLAKPTVCPRCRVEQPAGSQMASFVVGSRTLTRCAVCEQEVATRAAEIEQSRLGHIRTIPDGAPESEAQLAASARFGGPRGPQPLAVIAPKMPTRTRVLPFSELSEDTQIKQARAVGDGTE